MGHPPCERGSMCGKYALKIAPTFEGAPSKLRLGGGFLRGLLGWENSEALRTGSLAA
jgi:hypothetical protein